MPIISRYYIGSYKSVDSRHVIATGAFYLSESYFTATAVAHITGHPEFGSTITPELRIKTAFAPKGADLARNSLCILATSFGGHPLTTTVPSSVNARAGLVSRISTLFGSV